MKVIKVKRRGKQSQEVDDPFYSDDEWAIHQLIEAHPEIVESVERLANAFAQSMLSIKDVANGFAGVAQRMNEDDTLTDS